MVMIFVSLIMCSLSNTLSQPNLSSLHDHNPFSYNLGVNIIPSKNSNTDVTICCHGYGHNNQIVNVVHSFQVIQGNLIGFNFPDYNITPAIDHKKAAYGTINEILPLVYLLKRCVSDLNIQKINLYGFSAGGGAVVNTLALLNQSNNTTSLEKIGITQDIKKQIINALEQGIIILDCPLKSIEEVMALPGENGPFETLADAYAKNSMRPIDAIQQLSGLHLTILLHFQNPDEILGNRDDILFADRLRAANKGTTSVIIGNDGGHNSLHKALWIEYKKMTK